MRGLSADTKILIAAARRILKPNWPMTKRQLHYRLLDAGIGYQNAKADYRRMCRATTGAQRRHRAAELAGEEPEAFSLPGEWFVDELRAPEMPNVWSDAASYIKVVRRSYRRDCWQNQTYHVELWSEKATALGSLRPVVDEWGIVLQACRGFASSAQEHETGKLFEDIEKEIVVLYVGDFDASGDDIPRDIHARAEAASGRSFRMQRLAIFGEDIKAFGLPPQRIKDDDPRAAAFRNRHGKNAKCIELDSLPVDELRRRVTEAIKGLIDFSKWDRQLMVQEAELKCIDEVMATVRNLPQLEAR